MSNLTKLEIKPDFSIHPATGIGFISLVVGNLENQIAFYQKALGLNLHWRENPEAMLGTGKSQMVHLVEKPGFKRYQHVTGLYHFAIRFPDRRELARGIARLFALEYPNYPTDHIMTKTTYLNDPEGNGIELYCESPEDGTWSLADGEYITRHADGSLSSGREPLDLKALFSHLKDEDHLENPAPLETHIGHVHLHVRDLQEAVDFYHGILGFDVMGVVDSMGMAFVSAGGYHHHVGLNTWQGEGAPPPPADSLGMRHFTVALPHQSALNEVIARIEKAGISFSHTGNGLQLDDPSENGVLLTTLSG